MTLSRPRPIFLIFVLVFSLILVGCTSDSDDGSSGSSLSTNSCQTLGLQSRIINGTQCEDAGSPVVELDLLFSDGSTAVCSGSLATSTKVVTAAHCFFAEPVSVLVSTGDQQSFGQSYQVHPNVTIDQATQAVRNDVAVLTLSEPLSAPNIPLVLGESVDGGDIIAIFGYGRDEFEQLGTLKSGEMLVSAVNQFHIFAEFSGQGSNSCNGDSGGPALLATNQNGQVVWGLVGVVSSGSLATCLAGDLSLFTNLQSSEVVDFLTEAIPGLPVI